ncbi:MAG: hypothetical protein ACK5LO_08980 [Leucobacter sp.]
MAGEITPLFGGITTQQGQKVSGGLARLTKREVEQVAARVEVEAVREAGHAFLTSVAMTNVSVLVNQAELHVKTNPATAPFMEQLVTGYAIGASRRLSGGL